MKFLLLALIALWAYVAQAQLRGTNVDEESHRKLPGGVLRPPLEIPFAPVKPCKKVLPPLVRPPLAVKKQVISQTVQTTVARPVTESQVVYRTRYVPQTFTTKVPVRQYATTSFVQQRPLAYQKPLLYNRPYAPVPYQKPLLYNRPFAPVQKPLYNRGFQNFNGNFGRPLYPNTGGPSFGRTTSVTGPRGNTVTQGAFGGTAVTGPGGTIAASNPRVAAQGRAAENNALGGAAGFGGGGFNQGFGGGGFNQGFGGGGFARRGPIVQQQTPFTNSVTGPRGNTVTQGAFGGTAVTGPGGTIAASNPRVAAQGRAAENNALGGAAGFGGGGFNQGFGGGGFYRRNLQEQEEEMIDEQEQEQFYVDQNVEEQQYHE